MVSVARQAGRLNSASSQPISPKVRSDLLGGGRDIGHRGIDKLDCTPKCAAVSASDNYPKRATVGRRRPLLAVRAIAGHAV
jgi:hypothetical protein